jgi:hypothetical protein
MEGKNGNIQPIKKYELHLKSGFMGLVIAGGVVLAIALIRFILIIIFEVENFPNKSFELIGPILLVIFLISFNIFLPFFIKHINAKSKYPLYFRTILISFIVSLILFLLMYGYIVTLH